MNDFDRDQQHALLAAYRRTPPAGVDVEDLKWLVRMVRLMAWFWALLGDATAGNSALYGPYVAQLGARLKQE
jgi:hypothetical protein